jgi:hypothetical protein
LRGESPGAAPRVVAKASGSLFGTFLSPLDEGETLGNIPDLKRPLAGARTELGRNPGGEMPTRDADRGDARGPRAFGASGAKLDAMKSDVSSKEMAEERRSDTHKGDSEDAYHDLLRGGLKQTECTGSTIAGFSRNGVTSRLLTLPASSKSAAPHREPRGRESHFGPAIQQPELPGEERTE